MADKSMSNFGRPRPSRKLTSRSVPPARKRLEDSCSRAEIAEPMSRGRAIAKFGIDQVMTHAL